MTNRNNASQTTANKLFLKLAPRRHSAQFYADDRYMLEAAARFVGAALERGEAGVVIATLDHRAGIAERLERRGLSVIRTREEGRYVEVDADQMLAAIMPAGRLDPIRFAEMLGDTTRRASAAARDEHHRLAVFGEAVSLLCSRGEHEAALQLEQLWNDLSQTNSCALFCGYAAGSFDRATHAEVFAKICAEHSDVLPEESYLDLKSGVDRLRYVAQLQQKAHALESEIAARKLSEQALARSEKLAEVGRLTASIAHEINNPLTSLTNLFYLINTDASLDPAARHYAALADEELRRTARITRQMLAFYRDSSSPVPCKLALVVDEVLELYEPRLRKNSITVEKQYMVEGSVEGFPAEMRQLFANLIGNAIEAIGSTGKILVRVGSAREGIDPRKQGVRVSIADTGPGISAEDQKRIFEPFFTTKGVSGTGLGLWVSRGIVEKHEGRIRFRSRPRQDGRGGTVFSIFLPVSSEHPAGNQGLDALAATG
ncbi:MAG TPA: ATP-binding protein [Candidatus Angelobacter sp.]|nr:ATP-binding protein [Candidatus Angelobacter sp.]